MKRFFAGGNTAYGFKGYFDEIRDRTRRGGSMIIKGGAGMGKSTLMKRVAEYLTAEGYEVQSYFCSGDSDSLDGVYAPELNFAVMDGTSPHVCEPACIGVEDCYIDVSRALDATKVSAGANEIKALIDRKSSHYVRAYAYLGAAGRIAEMQRKMNADCDTAAEEILDRIGQPDALPKGVAKKSCYLSAITAEGRVGFEEYDFGNAYGIRVDCGDEFASLAVMDRVFDLCVYRNIACIGYRHPLLCESIASIYFEDEKILLSCETEQAREMVRLTTLDVSEERQIDEGTCANLIECAEVSLKKAKEAHGALEKMYVAAMDWRVLDDIYLQITDRIQCLSRMQKPSGV